MKELIHLSHVVANLHDWVWFSLWPWSSMWPNLHFGVNMHFFFFYLLLVPSPSSFSSDRRNWMGSYWESSTSARHTRHMSNMPHQPAEHTSSVAQPIRTCRHLVFLHHQPGHLQPLQTFEGNFTRQHLPQDLKETCLLFTAIWKRELSVPTDPVNPPTDKKIP